MIILTKYTDMMSLEENKITNGFDHKM